MVSTARQQAQEATYEALKPLLTKQRKAFLDELLEVDSSLKKNATHLATADTNGSQPGTDHHNPR